LTLSHNPQGLKPQIPRTPVESAEGRPHSRQKRHSRRRGAEIGLVLLSILAFASALALAEKLARTWFPAPDIRTSIDELHTYSEVYGWELRKAQRFDFDGHKTTINTKGYRGPELPGQKGHQRVLVLGDSISFGVDVSDDQTFSHLLQTKRSDLEVANLAVPGYGPDQQLIKLEREGIALGPDVVIVGACLSNDLADATLGTFLYDDRHPKPFFRLEAGRLVKYDSHLELPWRSRLTLFLTEHSRLYQIVVSPRGRGDGPKSETDHWLHRRKVALKDRAPVVELTARLWGRMAELSRDAGASFVILAFPEDDSYESRSPWLDELAASPPLRDVTIVDMGQRLRDKGFAFENVAADTLGHLSPSGHQVTADIVQDVLSEKGFAAPTN
jgi:hypothetical protein